MNVITVSLKSDISEVSLNTIQELKVLRVSRHIVADDDLPRLKSIWIKWPSHLNNSSTSSFTLTPILIGVNLNGAMKKLNSS